MKIAICTPVYGSPTLGFMDSLEALKSHTAHKRPDIEINRFTIRTSTLPASRNHLAQRALDWGAEWILWLDADQTFAANTLVRLLDLSHPVIGCNYVKRSLPASPTAYASDGQPVFTTDRLAATGKVEEVAYLGMGVLLTSRTAIENIPHPRFELVPDPNGLDFLTEDYVFCDKVRRAGGRVMVDHGLSSCVGHVGEFTFTHSLVKAPAGSPS